MNSLVISALSIASISAIASTLNAVYQLRINLKSDCSISGYKELQEYMNATNYEYMLKILKSSFIHDIDKTIADLEAEIADINKRIEYNKSKYIRCYPFLYRFHNSKKRLMAITNRLKNEMELIKLGCLLRKSI